MIFNHRLSATSWRFKIHCTFDIADLWWFICINFHDTLYILSKHAIHISTRLIMTLAPLNKGCLQRIIFHPYCSETKQRQSIRLLYFRTIDHRRVGADDHALAATSLPACAPEPCRNGRRRCQQVWPRLPGDLMAVVPLLADRSPACRIWVLVSGRRQWHVFIRGHRRPSAACCSRGSTGRCCM